MSVRTKRKRSDTAPEAEKFSAVSEVQVPKEKRRKWRPRHNKKKKAKSGADDKTDIVSTVDNAASWSVSRISSGNFRPKALFSKDEKYLLFSDLLSNLSRSVYVATERVIKQYNVRTGQFVRSFGST